MSTKPSNFGNRFSSVEEQSWKKSKHYKDAEVAQFRYQPAYQSEHRYIVKRESAIDKRGKSYYRYHCIVTNDEQTGADKLIHWQLGRCQAENLIKEHKSGFSLEKLPTRSFMANWAYLLIGQIAFNLVMWFKKLVLPRAYGKATIKSIRHRILNLAGKIVRTGRKLLLILSNQYNYKRVWEFALRQLEKLKLKFSYP